MMPRHSIPAACIAMLLVATACAANHQPTTVPVAGASVYVDDAEGSGLPIVFIHGNGGSSKQWSAQLQHFRVAGRRAIAIDLPGFGQSPMPPGRDLSLGAMATAVDQATHALHVDRFVIVGHSYGGAVVAEYAALHPDNVAGVVYVDAAVRIPLTAEQVTQVSGAIRADKSRMIQAMFAPLLKSSTELVQKEVLASADHTIKELGRKWACGNARRRTVSLNPGSYSVASTPASPPRIATVASIHHYGLRFLSLPEMIGGTTTAAQSMRRFGSDLAEDSS
jgi:pimeloyl-ACP methyl ester carboxylesterase